MVLSAGKADEGDSQELFKDFTEPDMNKTGYLIPLACGHNGQFNINEKTIYEIHLANAGFIQEQNSTGVHEGSQSRSSPAFTDTDYQPQN